VSTVGLRDVSKVFPDGTVAVDRLSLDIDAGEFMVLLGPSGCGKSTILRMIAGLEDVTSGDVLLDGMPADSMTPRERGVAMVFQDFALYPHMTVNDNIGFPLKVSGQANRYEQVSEIATALGIGDVLGRRPSQLSGGQRQRVAMGRAIVRRPKLFLMDEPLSNLDSQLRGELRAEISSLVRGLGVTCVYVTHDQSEALTMADRVAIMRRGVLQDVGTPTDVYGRPATLYVAGFLGSPRMSLMEATVKVVLDRHVALRVGDQDLRLPWNDLRARTVAHYHGERIVVGVRPEALLPVSVDSPGDVLRGRIRHMEHHGHESLAFVDVGATAVVVDEMASATNGTPTTARGLRRLVDRFVGGQDRLAGGRDSRDGRTTEPHSGESGGRHHRKPAELVVRLAPYPGVGAGHPMAIAVRIDALHFFEEGGNRIDVGRR
jgi:multiple sugar transport system ATP-binding protein